MKFGAGRKLLRLEDPRLVTGAGRFIDDLACDGALHLALLRSPHAHARIGEVDLAAARAVPGVVVAATGRDLVEDGVQPIPLLHAYMNAQGLPMASPPRHPIAVDRVRHVGEIVAAVVATSRPAAEDAVARIDATFEDLPSVVALKAAVAPNAALVWPAAGSNIVTTTKFGDAARVEAAFAAAAHIVRVSLRNQRIAAAPLEPRGALAVPDATNDRIVLHTASQNPTALRDQLAAVMQWPRERLQVKVPEIGGGFGMKGYLYPEDALVAYFASRLQRAVKWSGTRTDDFLGATHARDQIVDAALAFDAALRILALRSRIGVNLGAYPAPAGPLIALTLGPKVATSVYHVPLIDIEGYGVLTHTQATAPYRGAGRPEAIFTIERLLDAAAAELGVDPVELRRRNLITAEQMPYTSAIGERYDSGNFPALLDAGLQAADWMGFAQRKRQSEAAGRLRGRGLSMFLEWTGGNAFSEKIRIAIQPDGKVVLETAVQPMGQGLQTSFAQLLCTVFAIEPERLVLRTGDTDMATGFGSFGSRSLFVGGSAVALGARAALDAFRAAAAAHLEASAADLVYARERFSVAGTDHAVTLTELAAAAPAGELSFTHTETVQGGSWPAGVHVCEVEIAPDTGVVKLARYTCVDDVGVVINPMIVEGQIQGGLAQGVGQALMEQVIYEVDTGQLQTASFQDYAIPRAADLPFIESHLDQRWPCRTNPLGAKGAGESGTVGSPPAVMAAILDALRPLGITHLDMPATPAQVWRAIHAAKGAAGSRN